MYYLGGSYKLASNIAGIVCIIAIWFTFHLMQQISTHCPEFFGALCRISRLLHILMMIMKQRLISALKVCTIDVTKRTHHVSHNSLLQEKLNSCNEIS